ncbi:hypothetical protein [Runella salmonicolor]|uniref:Uncharacterized protein n=1 Tax=Runella salmonicolor TaxID=2950278 RepID=A0ABT1FGL5_9BACT|nr:hypothetical protein [Runella salmonicolor]MCP1380877.1 hypothetical protein [Runella salmonicolor]
MRLLKAFSFFVVFSFCLLYSIASMAHVGSAGVLFQGQAGAYRVLVSLQPPDVIPGTAQVTVYVESGNVTGVLARPIYFRTGDKGAPSSDVISPVPNQAGQFQGIVWLMAGGASSVQITLDGDDGKKELIVPIVAVSTAQRDMPAGLGVLLSILGLLLVVILITAIGASASDGLLRKGASLTPKQRRSRWVSMGVAAVACTGILYIGSSWWNSWADDYKRYMYKPILGSAKIINQNNERVFQLTVDTNSINKSSQRRTVMSFLIPDHGKLMHLFLVRQNTLDAFAHLHPERRDTTTFEAYLPKLPAGRYLVYADVVQRSGFAETITDTIDIPEIYGNAALKTDPEDTYVVTDPLNNPKQIPVDENVVICGKPGTKTKLKDGTSIVWEGKPEVSFEAGKPYQLAFEVFGPDGKPAVLEPYLGMNGHAAIVRSDGSVYIHLHPVGTYSMAAQQIMQNRIADTTKIFRYSSDAKAFRDSIDRYIAGLKLLAPAERDRLLMASMSGMSAHDMEGMKHENRIVFPYAFPKAGQYRIFLQIKRNGQVLTGIFDANVKEASM